MRAGAAPPVARAALLALALGARADAAYHCRPREEVRGGTVSIVSCRGDVIETVPAAQYGKYAYSSGESGHEWTSDDARVLEVTARVPCDASHLTPAARCLEVPAFFAWCESRSELRWVADSRFPRGVEGSADMLRATAACFGANATAVARGPLHPYNRRAVDRAEALRRDAADTLLCVLLGIGLCWCVCTALGEGAARRTYGKV